MTNILNFLPSIRGDEPELRYAYYIILTCNQEDSWLALGKLFEGKEA